MEADQAGTKPATTVSEQLLGCFSALKRVGSTEITFEELSQKFQQIQNGNSHTATGAEPVPANGEGNNNADVITEALQEHLEALVMSKKLKSVEKDGKRYYSLAGTPKPRRSRPDAAPPLDDTMKEMSHIIGKCVKQINQVSMGSAKCLSYYSLHLDY